MAGGGRVCLGQIGAAHGVRGEVRLHSFTADPAAIASYGPLESEDGRIFEIEAMRAAKDHFVARISGVADRNAAELLKNTKLYVPRERLPAPDHDEFYHADLVGLAVVDRAGHRLGTVIAVHNFGAGDLIEISPQDGGKTGGKIGGKAGSKTELLPFDEFHVPVVDIAAGQIVVVLPTQNASESD